MEITFKNVDQGDSIIVEWEQDGEPKIGIIDCSLRDDGSNPVVEYIAAGGYTEIEFVVLSHPHEDHYSGMQGLLNLCYDMPKGKIRERIRIRAFYCSTPLKIAFLNAVFFDTGTKQRFDQLFETVHALLNARKVIGAIRPATLRTKMTGPFAFLAPDWNYLGMIQYQKRIEEDKGTRSSKESANLLSTVIKIGLDDSYALLTSDAPAVILEDVVLPELATGKSTIKLAQVPHHGAGVKKNKWVTTHSEEFWDQIPVSKGAAAVVSVGPNSYGHPDPDVVSYFNQDYEKLYATNPVGPLGDYAIGLTRKQISDILDLVSYKLYEFSVPSAEIQRRFSGDQKFAWESDQLIWQESATNTDA